MGRWRRTYRVVDGQRIEGTWRHIFRRNGDVYYLTDLIIYADGAIDCGGGALGDLAKLRKELDCGCLATTLPEGGEASAHHLGSWRFAEPRTWLDAEMLAGEVVDEIDRLNDRPDSTDRCLLAVEDYLADSTETNRLIVRSRYLAIPKHLRIYSLGDMDRKDWPLRVLVTAVGETLPDDPFDDVVTEDMRAEAIEYFRERDAAIVRWQERVPADGPDQPKDATVTIPHAVYPRGWPDPPGIEVLQNDYPARIVIDTIDYPSVSHAYWALSTCDSAAQERIRTAPRAYDAQDLAEQEPRRDGWESARLAVMAALLRAKYTQHSDMADALLRTGDARLVYQGWASNYWTGGGDRGINWIGRLLELVRSELAAAQTGSGMSTRTRAR